MIENLAWPESPKRKEKRQAELLPYAVIPHSNTKKFVKRRMQRNLMHRKKKREERKQRKPENNVQIDQKI